VAASNGNSDEYLRSLLRETLRRVDGPGQGPVTRRATVALLHDLGRNIANAYHWHHLLLAVRRDGEVDPATERAIQECIRAINNGGKVPRDNRRFRDVRRAWNERTPAMVM
jgi:hypothetical protein